LEQDAKRCETSKLLFVVFNLLLVVGMQVLQGTMRRGERRLARRSFAA
jgi:hypothetical protein